METKELIEKNAVVMEQCLDRSISIVIKAIKDKKMDDFYDVTGIRFDTADLPDYSKQFILSLAGVFAGKIFDEIVKGK